VKTLNVSQLKPNPAGKDRPRSGNLNPSQLAGEWVDIKNIGTYAVDLEAVELNDRVFGPAHPQGQWASILTFPSFLLPAGKTVRVHSGQHRDLSVIRAEDREGAEYHHFTGRDAYVWNNAQGDTAGLWDLRSQQWIDSASYDPNPPEGVVLVRSGVKLIHAPALTWRYR
jgi:hypothetical protein